MTDKTNGAGELDPMLAKDRARTYLRYVQGFIGQTFSAEFDSPDRQNLAMALDYLEEAAAMLLNLSDRAQHAQQAVESEREKVLEEVAQMVDQHAYDTAGELGSGSHFARALRISAKEIRAPQSQQPAQADKQANGADAVGAAGSAVLPSEPTDELLRACGWEDWKPGGYFDREAATARYGQIRAVALQTAGGQRG